MKNQNQSIKYENHVILAVILFASTFLSWIDTFGMGRNLWDVASGAKQMASFNQDAWLAVILLYAVPLGAAAIIIAHLQNHNASAKQFSGILGGLISLVTFGALTQAMGKGSRESELLSMFLSPGIGALLAAGCGVLMLFNYFGIVTIGIAGLIGKVFKSPSPETSTESYSEGSPVASQKLQVSIPLDTKKAKDAAAQSVNLMTNGFEASKILVEQNGLKSLVAGIVIGVLLIKQPLLAIAGIVGFIAYSGIKRQAPVSTTIGKGTDNDSAKITP